MAKKSTKKKAATPVIAEAKKPRKDPRIESTFEETITFTCPKRGLVTQKVKVKRYKPLGEQANRHVLNSNDAVDKLEEQDDGLSIYSDAEDLGDEVH
jgi:hypothetical protein